MAVEFNDVSNKVIVNPKDVTKVTVQEQVNRVEVSFGGPQGAQGTTGSQGITGIQGVQGRQGTQGIQGLQGTQGTQGIQGLTGIQGIQGIQGTQGVQGIQGPQGIQGTTGLQGFRGTYTVSETAPLNPNVGDAWFNSTTSQMYIRYDGYWVETSNSYLGPSGIIAVTAPITNSGTSTSAQLGFSGLITAASTSTVPLTLQASSGQSVSILDIVNSSSTVLGGFGNTGNLKVRTPIEFSAALNVQAASTTQIGAVIRGASGQTEDLQEWQTWNGTTATTVAKVDSTGNLSAPTIQLTSSGILSSGGSTSMGVSPNRNVFLNSVGGSYGGGLGVTFIGNSTTVPTSNPTGGGILYVDGGALKYRGTSGSAGTIINADGTNGAAGQGVPTGGTTGQVLSKINGTDYNTQWVDQTGGGTTGDSDQVVLATQIFG
jgi:hypothetical protein